MSANNLKFSRELRANQTDPEKKLWYHIRKKRLSGIRFRRQRVIGNYIVDFVSLENKLIVELDGYSHKGLINKHKDKVRTQFLNKQGFRVIRFWNSDVIKNIEKVLARIEKSSTPSQPSPSKGKEIDLKQN